MPFSAKPPVFPYTILHPFLLPALIVCLFACGGPARKTAAPNPGADESAPIVMPAQPPVNTAAPGVDSLDTLAEEEPDSSDTSSAAEDPGEFIEQAKALCAEGQYGAADSNLREAVRIVEKVGSENEANEEWFPASEYISDIVQIYAEKMPAKYPLPDDIATTAFQRQMVTSLDSLTIAPSESLSIAASHCYKAISYDVPMVWNQRVQRALYFYIKNRSITIDRWFIRAAPYLSFMRRMFIAEGLPQDLVYLPLIESGFNPLAYSFAAASGIWQFIASTGRLYGLQHSYWLDERRDPIRATQAATRYLKKLFDEFGHWHLALAAYNCGEHGVSRSIARCRTKDFWRLRLPRETKNYVPSFLAALTIAKNPRCFGVAPQAISDSAGFDTVHVKECVSLLDIAQGIGVSGDSLRKINPHILRWCTPPDTSGAVLYLPKGSKKSFQTFFSQLPPEKKVRWCRYQVRKGETIQKIAGQFHVSPEGVRAINRLQDVRLTAGRWLFLPMADSATGPMVAYIPPELPKDDDEFTNIMKYRISKGDCLGSIARKFHTTVNRLCRLNHISGRSLLRPGRMLIVRAAPAAPPAPSAAASPVVATVQIRAPDTEPAARPQMPVQQKPGDTVSTTQPPQKKADTGASTETVTQPAAQSLSAPAPAPQASAGPAVQIQTPPAPAVAPTQAQSAQPAVPTQAQKTVQKPKVYVVQFGNTPFSIARKTRVAIRELLTWNRLDPSKPIIHVGDTLLLGPPAANEVAKPDTTAPPMTAHAQDTARKPALPDSMAAAGPKPRPSDTTHALLPKTGGGDTAPVNWSGALDTVNKNRDSSAAIIPVSAGGKRYVIQPGDNLFRIAHKFSVPLENLVSANNLRDSTAVRAGDTLLIPQASGYRQGKRDTVSRSSVILYTIRDGDTLWRIASRFGVSVSDLCRDNHLKHGSVIVPGDTIKIVKAGTP